MDARLDTIIRNATELGADYVTNVAGASAKFLDRLIENVSDLTRGVIEDGVAVVAAATEAFLPEASEEKADEAEDGEDLA